MNFKCLTLALVGICFYGMIGCSDDSSSGRGKQDDWGPYSEEKTLPGSFTSTYSYIGKGINATCTSSTSSLDIEEDHFFLQIVPDRCVDLNGRTIDAGSIRVAHYLGAGIIDGRVYFYSQKTGHDEVVGHVIPTGLDVSLPDASGVNQVRLRYLNQDEFVVEDSWNVNGNITTIKGKFSRTVGASPAK